jgi:uncharacterized protein (DUF736 family)
MEETRTESLKDRKIGAIWERTTRNGAPKLSLQISDTNYIALRNNLKRGNQPDWTIFRLE